ncbi:MAG: nucleotidyltransferase family protein [Candidatus Omnitrophica bacterium]|nr:nucleotidyltransferase family protein [Candidatus Omnitrophota bacterium]
MKNGRLKQIVAVISKNIEYLRDTYNVKVIGIFGSTVHGDYVSGSDVDILVELSQPVGFFKFIELEDYLSKILGRKVDLVTKKALKPFIKKEVLKETVFV